MDKQTKIDLDITEPEAKEWEAAWKQWAIDREKNRRAGTQTITIGDTITITVPADTSVSVIKSDDLAPTTYDTEGLDWSAGVE